MKKAPAATSVAEFIKSDMYDAKIAVEYREQALAIDADPSNGIALLAPPPPTPSDH